MSRPASVTVQLAQIEVRPGRPGDNLTTMLRLVTEARAAGVELIAFPEMALPGYLLGDEWEREAFLRDCEACGEELRAAARDLIVVFGNVAMDWHQHNEDGRIRKYNACFVAEHGRFVAPDNGLGYPFVIKTLLPNYREFDDSRHFFDLRKLALQLGRVPADLIAPVITSRLRLGCVLCEDAWDRDYALSPLRALAARDIDLFINVSCSPYTLNKNHKRNRVFAAAAATFHRPLAYVNNTGIQDNGKTVFTFDGASCLYDGLGHQLTGPAPFTAGILQAPVPLGGTTPFGSPVDLKDDTPADMAQALLYGTERFMATCGVRRVVIGASGGIDSCLVAALYRRLLPPEDLLIVNLPSRHNSALTRSLARDLARDLDCAFAEIPIEDSVRLTAAQIDGLTLRSASGREQVLKLSPFMLENVQARDRSSRVLAALAAAFGGVFTCNANKAEATVGYTTLYGDLGGYLANIADLWKGEVYAVARHLNEAVFPRPVIPAGAFTVVPSAELGPHQNVDEGKGDPLVYPYHDCLFRNWVEAWNRTTPEEALDWYQQGVLADRIGYAGSIDALFPTPAAFIADLERWWTQYQGMGVAKRIQAPPILAIKRRAFGFDHREAQLGVRYTRRYLALKQALLQPAT